MLLPASGYTRAMDRLERQVYDAIAAEPDLHPRDYRERLGLRYSEGSRAAQRLVAAGLIMRTGNSKQIRYWPAATDADAD